MLHVVEDKLGEEEKEENEGYVVIDEEVVLDESLFIKGSSAFISS